MAAAGVHHFSICLVGSADRSMVSLHPPWNYHVWSRPAPGYRGAKLEVMGQLGQFTFSNSHKAISDSCRHYHRDEVIAAQPALPSCPLGHRCRRVGTSRSALLDMEVSGIAKHGSDGHCRLCSHRSFSRQTIMVRPRVFIEFNAGDEPIGR